MGDVEAGQTEEQTQAENPEPAEQEQPPEESETPPEEPEASEEEEPAEEPEGEPAAATEDAATAEEKRRRKGGWERRAERAERRAEQAERERALLLEQLSAGKPAQTPGKEPTPDERAAEYISSLVQQGIAAEKERERQAATQAEFQRKQREFQARTPDFEDVIAASSHIPVPDSHLGVILTSPDAPAIMYQLARNPDELARISRLPLAQAAREIGRLEEKLASSTAAPKTQPIKSAKRPPAPPTSVGGSPASARNRDDLPIGEYKKAFRSKG